MRKRKKKAIIRWHNFNLEKEPEKHFRSRIMLFMPWRQEDNLRKNYRSYADRYHDEIDKIKKVEYLFIHHEEEINDAFQQLQAVGPPEDAWDSLAPGAEESQQVAQQQGIADERPMAEEDIQAHIDQIVNEQPQSKNDSLSLKYTKEARKELLTTEEYNKYMQHLNEEQKVVIMYHRKWCKEAVVALKTKSANKTILLISQWSRRCWEELCCETHTYRHCQITTMCTPDISRGHSNTIDSSNRCSGTQHKWHHSTFSVYA